MSHTPASVVVEAPAKVNLTLEILDEREDLNGEEDEVLRDLIARMKGAIAKTEGRKP